jgi:HAE1 family hydrophobic/amphiphilic exporter-1
LTISSATLISAFVSLTLSPAIGSLVLRPPQPLKERPGLLGVVVRESRAFNNRLRALSARYGQVTARIVRSLAIVGVIYVLLIAVAGWRFLATPSGFIPNQDQGYLIGVVQLPPGASLQRTDAVVKQSVDIAMKNPALQTAVGFAGLDGATFSTAPNSGVVFFALKPHGERKYVNEVQSEIIPALGAIKDGNVLVIAPPPVQGIGTAGGFKMMVEDRGGLGYPALAQAAGAMMADRCNRRASRAPFRPSASVRRD